MRTTATGAVIQVTVRKDLLEWVAEQVKVNRFGSRSHAINYALTHVKDEVSKKPNSETA